MKGQGNFFFRFLPFHPRSKRAGSNILALVVSFERILLRIQEAVTATSVISVVC